jgi:hypothetical protein
MKSRVFRAEFMQKILVIRFEYLPSSEGFVFDEILNIPGQTESLVYCKNFITPFPFGNSQFLLLTSAKPLWPLKKTINSFLKQRFVMII